MHTFWCKTTSFCKILFLIEQFKIDFVPFFWNLDSALPHQSTDGPDSDWTQLGYSGLWNREAEVNHARWRDVASVNANRTRDGGGQSSAKSDHLRRRLYRRRSSAGPKNGKKTPNKETSARPGDRTVSKAPTKSKYTYLSGSPIGSLHVSNRTCEAFQPSIGRTLSYRDRTELVVFR